MFQDNSSQTERGERLKRIIAFGGAAAIVATAAFFALRADAPPPDLPPVPPSNLEGAMREGAPEFDAYRKYVTIEEQLPVESSNLLGQVTVVVRGVLQNRGNRDLSGVELKAMVTDMDGNMIAERIAVPVPRLRQRLAPGESMRVHVNIDPVPRDAVRTNAFILLRGLKFGSVPHEVKPAGAR